MSNQMKSVTKEIRNMTDEELRRRLHIIEENPNETCLGLEAKVMRSAIKQEAKRRGFVSCLHSLVTGGWKRGPKFNDYIKGK